MTLRELLIQLINQHGVELMLAVATTVGGAIAAFIGKVYKQKVTDETKRKVAKTCCTAVEMLYKDIKGEEKLAIACKNITEMLSMRGIMITELELRMLIEEVCYDFAHAVREEITKTENPVAGFVGGEDEAVVPA